MPAAPTILNPRLIDYVRVSDARGREGEENFQSTKQQRTANEAIVSLTKGARIVDRVEALNASGGKDWPEAKLAEVIARVDRGEADGVVVYSLDRWGRSLRALEVIERWAQEGKTFLSASDKFDAATPSGRMALRMMMVVARYYYEMTQDRFALSQRDAVKAGKWIGKAPLGYVRSATGQLVIDPETAPIITEAFRIAARDGLHAAVAHFAAKVPGKVWTTTEARRILRCKAYLGEVHHGELSNIDEPHDALTTRADYEAAQTEPRGRRSNGDYPLSHIARCGRCGAGMVGALQTVRGKAYRRMRCSAVCQGGAAISADKLEGYVVGLLAEALADDAVREAAAPEGIEAARRALDAAEAERGRFGRDVRARELLGESDWYASLAARAAAVKAARDAYQAIAQRAAHADVLPMPDELDDPAQLARALRLIDVIVVAPGRGEVADRATVAWTFHQLKDMTGALAA